MKITVKITTAVPLASAWRAYTTPEDIKQWNFASPDWHTPTARVELRVGGQFCWRMEAKDGGMGFDFAGTYTKVIPQQLLEYVFGDRIAAVQFSEVSGGVEVRVTFDAETTHTEEQQRAGWQAILDNYSNYVSAKHQTSSGLLQGSCHCGAVRLELPSKPEVATDCNCSICRRVAGIWAYFEFGSVKIQGHPEATVDYIWGDRSLRTIRCGTCGCVTHWEPLEPTAGARHGVNLRNFDPALIADTRIRKFDGADTWAFVDE